MSKSLIRHLLFLFLVQNILLFSQSSLGNYEPSLLDPELDQNFVADMGFSDPWGAQRINLLMVVYDLPTASRVRAASRFARDRNGSRRFGLTSRSDIMMVLSFNRVNRSIDVISVGRDFQPSPSCNRRAEDAGLRRRTRIYDAKINAAPILYGRAAMVYCISTVMGEFLESKSIGSEFELTTRHGRTALPIHGLMEGTRGGNRDGGSLGTAAALGNSAGLAGLAMSVYDWSSINTMRLLLGRAAVIVSGLRRRDYAVAGSYQRAFNNAKFVTDLLGYTAPLVESTAEDGFSLLSDETLFAAMADKVGLSHPVSVINQHLSYYPTGQALAGDNMFRYGAFVPNPGTGDATRSNPFGPEDMVSPARVIQIGGNIGRYATYQMGTLDLASGRANGDSYLQRLRVRPVLQIPGETVPQCPTCQLIPEFSEGGRWGGPILEFQPE